MTFSALSIALALVVLAGYAALELGDTRVSPRARVAALSLLVGASFVFHIGVLARSPDGGLRLRAPPPHLHEWFHYYLGARYFPEVGYADLYAATVIADFEDEEAHFRPDAPMRDLASGEIVARGLALSSAERVKAAFGPERWVHFKQELAILRDANPGDLWHGRGYVIDHGYNGTPLVTALLSSLARQPWLATDEFIDLFRILDPYLLMLLGVGVAALEGPLAGLSFLFFMFANPLNEYGFVGGGYLRYAYLIVLALALIALRANRLLASGVLFAVTGGLRVFPLVFPALLLLRDLMDPGRGARLRTHARFYAGFAITGALIVVGTSMLTTPDGRNPWLAFADNIALHAETPSANQIGLAVPFGYAPEKDVHRLGPGASDELSFNWVHETQRVLHEREAAHGIAALSLLALALLALRRGDDRDLLLTGLLVVFAVLPLSHYYYAMLGLVPLVLGTDRRIRLLLLATYAALTVLAAPSILRESVDLKFSLFSGVVLAFLLAALALRLRRPQPAP